VGIGDGVEIISLDFFKKRQIICLDNFNFESLCSEIDGFMYLCQVANASDK
jgi:hypothetical protein